jgi:CheY-like chemotaxis protein
VETIESTFRDYRADSNKNNIALYIEDNAVNLELMQEIFSLFENYELVCSTDGITGVETAKTLKPDIILMDINMPGISGIEASKQLLQTVETKNIPIIGVSALAMESDRKNALSAGMIDYMTKPIDFTTLTALLKKYAKEPLVNLV